MGRSKKNFDRISLIIGKPEQVRFIGAKDFTASQLYIQQHTCIMLCLLTYLLFTYWLTHWCVQSFDYVETENEEFLRQQSQVDPRVRVSILSNVLINVSGYY